MNSFKMRSNILIFTIFSALLFLSSCGRREAASKGDVIGYVNKEPILASELKRSIELKARQDPLKKITKETEKEQLDIIIDKKLIIQAAVEQGLAREERFVGTIKTFWEQTLIRDFINYKRKELKERLSVSEEEVGDYYRHLGRRVTFNVVKSRDARYIEKLFKTKNIQGASGEIIGPVNYDEITSGVLIKAFDLPVGTVEKFTEGPTYYLVSVINKEDVPLKPLGQIRLEIEKRALVHKEKHLFDQWLKTKREETNITILKE